MVLSTLKSSKDDESIVYRNKKEAITFKLQNKGNSILRIIDIEIDIEDDSLDYDIRGQNDFILNWFTQGESTEIIVEIDFSDTYYKELDIEITITAVNILSNEVIIIGNVATVEVVDETISDLIIDYFIAIILSIIILFGILAYFFVKKIKKKMEIIEKEPTIKKPRRGRYVKITELEPEKIEKIEEPTLETEEKEPKEIKEVKTTDLDALIEEEIAKKEEKAQKKTKKLPKRVKKPSKKPKKVKTEPISAKKIEKRKKIKKEKKEPKKSEKQLKKKTKKQPKKVEPKRVKKKEKADLDDLLKEKGLDNSK